MWMPCRCHLYVDTLVLLTNGTQLRRLHCQNHGSKNLKGLINSTTKAIFSSKHHLRVSDKAHLGTRNHLLMLDITSLPLEMTLSAIENTPLDLWDPQYDSAYIRASNPKPATPLLHSHVATLHASSTSFPIPISVCIGDKEDGSGGLPPSPASNTKHSFPTQHLAIVGQPLTIKHSGAGSRFSGPARGGGGSCEISSDPVMAMGGLPPYPTSASSSTSPQQAVHTDLVGREPHPPSSPPLSDIGGSASGGAGPLTYSTGQTQPHRSGDGLMQTQLWLTRLVVLFFSKGSAASKLRSSSIF